jgi:hypothetical protein
MPAEPPRDQDGKIVPHDHPEIHDQHNVIRHIVPNDLHRETSGNIRVASGAYSESSDGGMSVDMEDWILADGLSTLHYLKDPTHGAVRISVRSLRSLGLRVGWDPDSGHRHHGAVWGINSTRRRRIAALAVTVKKVLGES